VLVESRARVMGSEIEWMMFGKLGRRRIPNILGEYLGPPPGECIGTVFMRECLPPELFYPDIKVTMEGNGIIMKNGARAYLDTGNHFEYATPEGLGPYEALINEKAGELITKEAVRRASEYFQEEGIAFSLFKSNLDVREVSCGLHENYSIRQTLITEVGDFRGLLALLGPHLISRIFYTGNGWVYFKNDRPRYCLSQRARVTPFNLTGTAVFRRSIINTKNEGLSEGGITRLHVVCGDATIAEPAIYLRFAVTDIILRMIEDGFLRKGFLGSNPNLVRAFKAFANDSTLRKPFDFGKAKFTVVNLEEKYRDLARRYFELHAQASAEDTRALNLWDEVIAAAKTPKPHEALATFTDWAIKKVLIEQDMERLGYGWASNNGCVLKYSGKAGKRESIRYRIKNIDLSFPRLVPAGVTDNPRVRRLMRRVATDEDILGVLDLPRPSCRSYARALQLKWFHDEYKRTGCRMTIRGNWSYLRGEVESKSEWPHPGRGTVVFSNPDPNDKEMGEPVFS